MDERDAAVVAKARGGDREAFRALVDRHSRYVFSLAHRMTGNAQDAEDVVQEAWLKAHRQLSRFEARADFRTWLHRITVNCSIDLIRARRHREDAHDPADLEQGPLSERGAEAQPTPERVAASTQISDRVNQALGLLTALEDLERVLLEIANAPADLTSNEWSDLKSRITTEDLLFRVRVIASEMRNRTRTDREAGDRIPQRPPIS